MTALLFIFAGCKNTPEQPEIQIEDVWSRPVIVKKTTRNDDFEKNKSYTGAVYLKINNTGGQPDKLLAAKSDICEVTEIHQTKIENGVMQMIMVEDGLEIPAKGLVEFKTGGHHIMLIGLKESLEPGKHFEISFHFEKSGILTSQSKIKDN